MPSRLNSWVTPPPETGKQHVSNSRRMPRALSVLKRLARSVGSSKSATRGAAASGEGDPPVGGQPSVTEADMDVSVEATLSSQLREEGEPSLSGSAGSSRRSTGSMYSRDSVAGLELRRSEGDEGEGGRRPCVTSGSGDEEVADMSLGSNSRGGDSDDSLVGVVEQQPASLRDVKVVVDCGELGDEGRDVCPDELQPRRPSRRGSLESRARSSSRNSEGRVSSEGRPSDSRQSWEIRDSYGSYGRPSWERPSIEYESRRVSTEELARVPPPTTRSEEWSHVFQGNAAKGVVSGEARGSKVSEHSFYSRSSAEVPFETVFSSALYSEQAELPSMSPLSRRASANDACRSSNSAELSSDERPYRSHELRRQGKAAEKSKPVSKSSFTTPQGYVDSLSLEEEAAAIVAPATKLAIAADGMKYRNLARCAYDRHAPHRQRATDAQLARLAFNLPSVRDVEHRRCRTEFRGGVVPQ